MPWEKVAAGIFFLKNETLLCTVHYYSKLPIVNKGDSLMPNDLVRIAKNVFTEI